MRNFLIWSVVFLAMTGTACNKGYQPPKPSWPEGVPKELTVDLGGGVKLEMVLIPAGEFMMGAPNSDQNPGDWDRKPQHRVRIAKPFYLGKYLVTQEQWETVMGSNVWEWCQDWFDSGYYAKSPTDDPRGGARGHLRVLRGGGWINPAWHCRSAHRCNCAPALRNPFLGFRVSLVPADKKGERAEPKQRPNAEHGLRRASSGGKAGRNQS